MSPLDQPFMRLDDATRGETAQRANPVRRNDSDSTNGNKSIQDARADQYDALIIPGGYSPDKMRRSPEMVQFIKDMDTKGKINAAICHAGWMLVSVRVLQG